MRELAVGRFGEAAASLKPNDDLFEILGIDSMQALDLLTYTAVPGYPTKFPE